MHAVDLDSEVGFPRFCLESEVETIRSVSRFRRGWEFRSVRSRVDGGELRAGWVVGSRTSVRSAER